MPSAEICPQCHQTYLWHLKVVDRGDKLGMMFGDVVGCDFIDQYDRNQHERQNRELKSNGE